MKWLIPALALMLAGCGPNKALIKKSTDEGYAKGYAQGAADYAQVRSADYERNLHGWKEQLTDCRERLLGCLEADTDK